MSKTITLSLQEAEYMIYQALTASGVSEAAARSTSTALVAAEADGQVGHGFSRVADYAAQARPGKVNVSAQPSLDTSQETFLHVDAGYGFAYPALDLGRAAGIQVALDKGTCSVGISKSHHCGSLSFQVEQIARAGLIGLMVANTPKAIAPFGGSEPLFGPNPIAFAAPRPNDDPLVIDLSLSVAARGKVMNAAKLGKEIPIGWAIDADGNDTVDPNAALAGSMLPIGGPKGYALALIVEILSCLVTGANTSAEASSFFTAEGPPPGVGQFMLMIRPTAYAANFAERFENLIAMIEAEQGTRLPGARRQSVRQKALHHGLSIPHEYVEVIQKLARGEVV